MSEMNVPLKNPWLAAFLAFLIPGLGHFYQGRVFKGAMDSVCILGTFFCGMSLGEWKVVCTTYDRGDGRRGRVLSYLAQVSVGLFALPAIVQSKRYAHPDNEPLDTLEDPLSAPFRGQLVEGRRFIGKLEGRIELKPVPGEFNTKTQGTFVGTLDGKQSIKLNLGDLISLDRKIGGSSRRGLRCYLNGAVAGEAQIAGDQIEGSIPRSFWNWFEVPLDSKLLNHLNEKLGKFYELALVYTWIAGLLNVLAIWDALEGPAYGYGNEEVVQRGDQKQADPSDQAVRDVETPGAGGDPPPPNEHAEQTVAET